MKNNIYEIRLRDCAENNSDEEAPTMRREHIYIVHSKHTISHLKKRIAEAVEKTKNHLQYVSAKDIIKYLHDKSHIKLAEITSVVVEINQHYEDMVIHEARIV